MAIQWQGSWVALATPFVEGKIDFSSLSALVEWHKANRTDGLVILGTTGESATISLPEREAIIRYVVEQASGEIPVMVGTGTNDTASTIALSQQAESLGADAVLVVTPYYNKPSSEGLLAHYRAVAEEISCPIILYNVPGRTACDMDNKTIISLANIENIIGLKDATGDLERLNDLKALTDFCLFSGDDASACEFLLNGGHGVISVTANICPALMHWMCKACSEGDAISARAMNDSMIKLHEDLFVESNPVPVKWLLAHLGRIDSAQMRLPLVELASCHHVQVKQAWQQAEAAEMNLEND